MFWLVYDLENNHFSRFRRKIRIQVLGKNYFLKILVLGKVLSLIHHDIVPRNQFTFYY